MKEFEKARQAYEKTPVPDQLEERIQAGIRQGRRNRSRRLWRHRLGTAAACFAVVLGTLNLSPAVAAAAADVPVLGGLFRVLTVREFTEENNDRTIMVQQPALEGDSALIQRVNQEIQKIVEETTARGEQLVAEYKDAFLVTGGTMEEWEAHDNTVSVSYEILSQTDTTVSFVVSSAVSIANAYQERTYYNLDLDKNRQLTLRDLLGEDWKSLCSAAVQRQIDRSGEDGLYYDPEMCGFNGVDEATSFYIREDNVPVLVFPRYTLAPVAVEIPVEQ